MSDEAGEGATRGLIPERCEPEGNVCRLAFQMEHSGCS